jgi:hypothetical protein
VLGSGQKANMRKHEQQVPLKLNVHIITQRPPWGKMAEAPVVTLLMTDSEASSITKPTSSAVAAVK